MYTLKIKFDPFASNPINNLDLIKFIGPTQRNNLGHTIFDSTNGSVATLEEYLTEYFLEYHYITINSYSDIDTNIKNQLEKWLNDFDKTITKELTLVITAIIYNEFEVYPVYAYEHSNIALSITKTNPTFDTKLVGFMYISKEDIIAYEMKDTTNLINNILAELTAYLNGDNFTIDIIVPNLTIVDTINVSCNPTDLYDTIKSELIQYNITLEDFETAINNI